MKQAEKAFTKVSVIIPCYNEARYVKKVVHDLVAQDYPKKNMEVFFVDGGSNDNTVSILQQFAKRYQWIQILHNHRKYVPYAMNLGIQKASGDVIIRMDAHAAYPPNYISFLVAQLFQSKADNVGVPWQTKTLTDTPRSRAIQTVLQHPLGVGNAHFRTGVDKPVGVDTVPFGCYRKSLLNKVGGYNENLHRNQDIELNKRIIQKGGKVLLFPDITCTYYARETFQALARNNYKNGLWNVLTVYITKDVKSLSIRHFIPLTFLLSLCLPLMSTIVISHAYLVSVASLLSYLGVIGLYAFRLSDKRTPCLYLFAGFVVLHISYGAGSLVGLLRVDKIFRT